MPYDLIYLGVLVLSTFLGLTTGWLVGRRWAKPPKPKSLPIDADTEAAIEDAAYRWALARGRPSLAPLVAAKLRALHRLRRPAEPDWRQW
jgi:hypothetical protein